MPNFKNGKIYRLVDDYGDQYIGSTTQTLKNRLQKHNYKCNTTMSRYLINPKIYLIEEFPCDKQEELEERERYYLIKNRKNILNICNIMTDEEKRDRKINRCAKHYKENKEYRLQWQRDYSKRKKEALNINS